MSGSDQSGKITLQAVVSDTGYVCSAKVIDGMDKKSDAEAEKTVRQWHFTPAKKDGHPVPVVVKVEVHYERDEDGNVILSSRQPSQTEQTPKQ
jgi:TonB family protein